MHNLFLTVINPILGLRLLAQDTTTTTTYTSSPAAGAMGAGGFIVWLIVMVLVIAGLWKVFTKAGQPGWGAIIPIYNFYLLCKVAGRPGWWLLLMFVPLLNLIIWIIVAIDIAKAFGKGAGFGIGIAFLGVIFLPILGFGSARYGGNAAPSLPAAI